jgi:predicted phosphate transport protein (TIGR00153 family)
VRIIPRDEAFFEMFAELAKRLTASARLLHQLFAEPHRLDEHVSAIKALEHEADNLTHEIILRIDRSFVTPIDREDIHLLASQLDTAIDLIDGTARRAQIHIGVAREPATRLTDVLVRASDALQSAVGSIKKTRIVTERARDVKRLEEEGDAIYHVAVGELFNGAPDPLEVIKWKDLYDTIEDALDKCEDVANVLESISLKHA